MKAVLDIETGGFSVSKNGVCEVAILAIDENHEEVDHLHIYIKPYFRDETNTEFVSYKPDAMAVNGLTVEFLEENGIDIFDACREIGYFFDSNNINEVIGHNVNFDMQRINHIVGRFTPHKIGDVKLTDTLDICRRSKMFTNNQLSTVCAKLQIPINGVHTALGDARATLQVHKSLTEY